MHYPATRAQKKVASRRGLTCAPFAPEIAQVADGSALAAFDTPIKILPIGGGVGRGDGTAGPSAVEAARLGQELMRSEVGLGCGDERLGSRHEVGIRLGAQGGYIGEEKEWTEHCVGLAPGVGSGGQWLGSAAVVGCGTEPFDVGGVV